MTLGRLDDEQLSWQLGYTADWVPYYQIADLLSLWPSSNRLKTVMCYGGSRSSCFRVTFMRKIVIGLAATAALIGTPALAADMAVKAPPPIASVAYDWTGFYFGGNVGWSRSTADFASMIGNGTGFYDIASLNFIDAVGTGQSSKDGFTGGGQLGYNWQSNNWVPGIEADFNALSSTVSMRGTGITPGGSTIGFTNSLKPDWIATVRPRLGYAFDRLMVYATAGLAVMHADYAQTLTNITGGLSGSGLTSANVTRAGWSAGAGLEYGLNRNWSVTAEYLYAGFSGFRASGTDFPGAGNASPLGGTAHLNEQMARAGINYRF